jgi:purine nucleosidase/pyrimidine-specific ribonucleoside hydrolase
MPDAPVPIVYDTDLGEDIDDLYALYLALFHPRINVLAVTTVHGDTQAKARLATKVLRMAGHPGVPVGAGIGLSEARKARGETAGPPIYTQYVAQTDPECGGTYPSAAEVIAKALADSPDPVALVGEGAFSNLAAALDTPGTREKIACYAVMGGETQRVMSEYNVRCDPEAADRVFTSGLPVFMGTFDLTAKLRMTMDDVDEHFGGTDHPVLRVLHDCTQLWGPCRGRKAGPVLYDLVPVFWLADNACVETRRSAIRVECQGTFTRGQTVRMPGDDGPVLESLQLDADDMVRQFIGLMTSAPDPRRG